MRTESKSAVGEGLIERSFEGIRARPLLSTPAASWSKGAVTDPSSINSRTFCPDRFGVRSAKVFGPFVEDSCLCGKHQGERSRGVCCEKCGVVVGSTRMRAERFGHIALPAPVPHPWLEDALVERSGVDRRTFDAVYDGSWAVVERVPASLSSWIDRGVSVEADALWGPWALRARSDRPAWWIDELPVLPPALRENVADRADRQPDLDALCARARAEGWNLERDPPPESAQLLALRGMDKLLVDVVRAARRLGESVEDDAPMVLRGFEAGALRESVRALFGPLVGARRSGRRLIDLCSARAQVSKSEGTHEALVALDRTLFAAGFARVDAAPAA